MLVLRRLQSAVHESNGHGYDLELEVMRDIPGGSFDKSARNVRRF